MISIGRCGSQTREGCRVNGILGLSKALRRDDENGWFCSYRDTQLAYCISLHFLYFPPEAAGGFAMPYFAYLASRRKAIWCTIERVGEWGVWRGVGGR